MESFRPAFRAAFRHVNANGVISVQNTPPTASNVSVETPMGVPVTVPLAATDPDGDPISFFVVSQPTNGTVVQVGGVVTYTPNSGFFGTDSFTYRATDGQLQSNQATASITVISATNQAPVANDLFYQVAPGGIIAIQYAGVDPDGDSLTYQRLNAPTGGVLFGATGSSVQFRAAPSFSGTTSFQYRAFDGALYSEPATVTIVSSTNPQ